MVAINHLREDAEDTKAKILYLYNMSKELIS